MEKEFILLQLFGDPAGDPNPNQPGDPPAGGDPQPGDGDDTSNVAQKLIDWKKKFVAKEDYDRVVKQRDDYLTAIIENKEDSLEEVQGLGKENPEDLEKLRRETFSEDCQLSDLQYAKNVLQIREAEMKAGKLDPFVSPNSDSEETRRLAQNVADVMQDCIDESEGNNASFIALFQSRIKENPQATLAFRGSRK